MTATNTKEPATMTTIDDINLAPWDRGDWHGSFISLGGCPAGDFKQEDVARVVAFYTSPTNDWDGDMAAIVRLIDGRFVAWEAGWGPTGSGFSEDAYGGDADVFFAHSEDEARMALSVRAREGLATG